MIVGSAPRKLVKQLAVPCAPGKSLPEFLGDVRHERMQQPQRLLQHGDQASACFVASAVSLLQR